MARNASGPSSGGGPNLIPPNLPFVRGRPGETRWEAQDKEVAVGDHRELGAVSLQQLGVKDHVSDRIRRQTIEQATLSWVPGPPSSHVHSFALWDARLLLVQRTRDGQYIVDSPADLPPSRIYVRFRPTKEGKHKTKRKGIRRHKARGITQYVYYTPKHTWLKDVYQKMLSSDHPGAVIHHYLVEEVPYQRVY